MKQSNVAPIACHKTISYITSIVQHHHIKTNIINLIPPNSGCGMLENVAANIWCTCLYQHVRLHKIIHISYSHTFLKIIAWHPRVWHCGRSCTSAKNRRPQPSSSYLLSMMTIFQCTERIHSRIVRLDRDDVLNLSTCNMACLTSTGELLYSIVRIPKMYVASSCLLSTACSMCLSPSALEPSS
jgi:hypothetical protein